MKYDVIATGSKGNAVVLEDSILVDCGVPFKALQGVYSKLKIVLLTHIHGDHFKPSTVKKLAAERPMLLWACCEWMVQPLIDCGVAKHNIVLLDFETGFACPTLDYGVEPFPLFHDVPNCGWIVQTNGKRALYATDTSNILVEAKNIDLYLVEANYEDAEIEQRIEKQILDGAEYIHEYKAMRNHMSEKDAIDWLVRNVGPKSVYVLLHRHEEKKEDA